MELADIRKEIDGIDDELVRLFVRRLQAADAVAEAKRVSGKPVLDPAREREILARVTKAAGLDFENEARLLFTTLLSVSRARQRERLAVSTDFEEKISAARSATPAALPSAVVVCERSADREVHLPRSVRRKMRIGIRGMGLIGGSFEKAFRRAGYEVVNLKDASPETIGCCGLVIVCLPPLMVAPWIVEHAKDFAADALVTDAAGVKGVVCPAVEAVAKGAKWTYVGGHPMAGKERSGYANADADLFRGASMILTPYGWTPSATVERLKELLAAVGFARFVVTDPRRHDEMIAYTSQLAHVVSSAYVRDPLAESQVGFSAGSYQDMTRVATVDPDIWTDLFLSNYESLGAVLDRLIDRLDEYRRAIKGGDAQTLKNLLAEGRAAKENAH